ncbi:hypothetical protein QL285_053834 [Trifolium repens]|nr:hypothetical protein QL285_053834 [Trifolium repens]
MECGYPVPRRQEGKEDCNEGRPGEAVVTILNIGLERRWNNTQHQPGEAVVTILNIGLERRWNNTQHQPEEAVIRILKFCRLQGGKHSETLVEKYRFEVELL